jgi:4-hydroxy-tetrahydrodipicolinate synthase
VTPFTVEGALDETTLRRLVQRQVEAGIHFLVPCGTTGESPTLSHGERRKVVEIVVEETGGRVPVLAGAGGYDTAVVVRLAQEMAAAGAQGLLSVTPYYNKPTADGLVRHFQTIAEGTPLPVIVYNVPGRTGSNVDPGTLARLAAIPNVVGVKEASGNMPQICELRDVVPEEFIVLSGDDVLTLPVMAAGGDGTISVAANEVPRDMVAMVEAAERNDFAAARATYRRLLPLMRVNFVESNPVPVKAALAMMGLVAPVYRLPLVPPREESANRIRDVLAALGLLSGAQAAPAEAV